MPNNSPKPPIHINCRCTLVPLLKSWEELGFEADELDVETRASMDGQVPAKLTYDDWLAQQPPQVVHEALGKRKGDEFLASRQLGSPLAASEFVAKDVRPKTLEQVERETRGDLPTKALASAKVRDLEAVMKSSEEQVFNALDDFASAKHAITFESWRPTRFTAQPIGTLRNAIEEYRDFGFNDDDILKRTTKEQRAEQVAPILASIEAQQSARTAYIKELNRTRARPQDYPDFEALTGSFNVSSYEMAFEHWRVNQSPDRALHLIDALHTDPATARSILMETAQTFTAADVMRWGGDVEREHVKVLRELWLRHDVDMGPQIYGRSFDYRVAKPPKAVVHGKDYDAELQRRYVDDLTKMREQTNRALETDAGTSLDEVIRDPEFGGIPSVRIGERVFYRRTKPDDANFTTGFYYRDAEGKAFNFDSPFETDTMKAFGLTGEQASGLRAALTKKTRLLQHQFLGRQVLLFPDSAAVTVLDSNTLRTVLTPDGKPMSAKIADIAALNFSDDMFAALSNDTVNRIIDLNARGADRHAMRARLRDIDEALQLPATGVHAVLPDGTTPEMTSRILREQVVDRLVQDLSDTNRRTIYGLALDRQEAGLGQEIRNELAGKIDDSELGKLLTDERRDALKSWYYDLLGKLPPSRVKAALPTLRRLKWAVTPHGRAFATPPEGKREGGKIALWDSERMPRSNQPHTIDELLRAAQHEFGHHYEFHDPVTYFRGLKYRQRRGTGQIGELHGEAVIEGAFPHPYMGRLYDQNADQGEANLAGGHTEITSMMFEALSPRSTVHNWWKDEEAVSFLWSVFGDF
jgi:hypothetical protein